jgi:hypothetical protein
MEVVKVPAIPIMVSYQFWKKVAKGKNNNNNK